jgi:hypothetical protein
LGEQLFETDAQGGESTRQCLKSRATIYYEPVHIRIEGCDGHHRAEPSHVGPNRRRQGLLPGCVEKGAGSAHCMKTCRVGTEGHFVSQVRPRYIAVLTQLTERSATAESGLQEPSYGLILPFHSVLVADRRGS